MLAVNPVIPGHFRFPFENHELYRLLSLPARPGILYQPLHRNNMTKKRFLLKTGYHRIKWTGFLNNFIIPSSGIEKGNDEI